MPDTAPLQMQSHLPAEHPRVRFGKTGLLILNLGTPDGTDYWSMRRYLSEFLSDKRVIEVPQAIWQFILQGPILTFRPSKSGHAYKQIWMEEEDKSPLLHFTEQQADKLKAAIGTDELVVDFAMRYGNPSIASKIDELTEQGCDKICLMALYPQYAAATTATAYDKAFDHLKTLRRQPAVRTLAAFHDHPAYIEALATSLERGLSSLSFKPDVLLMSFHGIPKAYFEKGDPYHCHCQKTARLVRERLGWSEAFCRVTFQSRFGPTEWLKPYTDKTLEDLPGEGVTKVAIAAPAFFSDCVETLEELAIAGKESFEEAGGEDYAVLPCLNDSDEAISLLKQLAEEQLGGWV